jgi:hypothetical protein
MSDEQRRDEETEVDGHQHFPPSKGANDEPADDDEDEFEAHIKFPNVRMD